MKPEIASPSKLFHVIGSASENGRFTPLTGACCVQRATCPVSTSSENTSPGESADSIANARSRPLRCQFADEIKPGGSGGTGNGFSSASYNLSCARPDALASTAMRLPVRAIDQLSTSFSMSLVTHCRSPLLRSTRESLPKSPSNFLRYSQRSPMLPSMSASPVPMSVRLPVARSIDHSLLLVDEMYSLAISRFSRSSQRAIRQPAPGKLASLNRASGCCGSMAYTSTLACSRLPERSSARAMMITLSCAVFHGPSECNSPAGVT